MSFPFVEEGAAISTTAFQFVWYTFPKSLLTLLNKMGDSVSYGREKWISHSAKSAVHLKHASICYFCAINAALKSSIHLVRKTQWEETGMEFTDLNNTKEKKLGFLWGKPAGLQNAVASLMKNLLWIGFLAVYLKQLNTPLDLKANWFIMLFLCYSDWKWYQNTNHPYAPVGMILL